MSTIPLTANALRPPEQPDTLGQFAKLMQLRQMQQMLPGQLAQQQENLKATQLENQQRDIQNQERTSVMDAFKKANGDPDKTYEIAAQSGKVTPQTLLALKQSAIEMKSKTLDLVTKQGAEASRQADLMVGAHDVIDKAKPEDRPAVYQQQLAGLQKQGVDISGLPQQYPGDDQFKLLGTVAQGHKTLVDQAVRESEQQKNAAQAAYDNAQTAKINAEINPVNPADKNIAEQKYRGILNTIQTKGVSGLAQGDLDWAKSYEASQAKTTTQSDSLGVTSTNTSKPSGLANVKAQRFAAVSGASSAPSGSAQKPGSLQDSLVDEIGQYKLNPTMLSRMTIKHPEIIAQVAQKYPDWSQSNYNAANKAITDLAPSGKTGSQITSYNTFLRHAGALYDAVNTLDNSKYSDLLNKPLNYLAQHTGDPRVADFMAAMQPPMKEFQSFLLNNHAMHEEDVKDAHALIDQNKTPQEIRAVLKRFAETGSARLSEQNESFKRVTGRDIPNLVSPQAAAAYNKITGQGSGSTGGGIPAGATGKAKGSDGQWHYHDAKGNDLGVAQ